MSILESQMSLIEGTNYHYLFKELIFIINKIRVGTIIIK